MIEEIKIVSSVLGLIIGMRVGIIGMAIFWFVAGITYLISTVPLALYKDGAKGFYAFLPHVVADIFVLVVWIVFIVLIGLRVCVKFFQGFGFHLLPPNLNRALGGALGLSVGWIIANLILR